MHDAFIIINVLHVQYVSRHDDNVWPSDRWPAHARAAAAAALGAGWALADDDAEDDDASAPRHGIG